jgi:hypothetical protein
MVVRTNTGNSNGRAAAVRAATLQLAASLYREPWLPRSCPRFFTWVTSGAGRAAASRRRATTSGSPEPLIYRFVNHVDPKGVTPLMATPVSYTITPLPAGYPRDNR